MSEMLLAELKAPIGLVAGNGHFPEAFVREATAAGLSTHVVAYRSETDPRIEQIAKSVEWIKIGQLGRLIASFKRAGVRQVAFCGGIRRVNLFRGVKLDWTAVKVVARAGSIRDDIILRAIAAELERRGLQVIAPHLLLKEYLPQRGVLTPQGFSEKVRESLRFGWEAAAALGSFDIGQTLVIKDGVIVACEGIEGTDATILRGGQLAGPGCVVIKRVKPQQDRRLDLPGVGMGTIDALIQVRAAGMVLEHEGALLLHPQEIVTKARDARLVLEVW
jgi:DUF1009 family protein